MWRINNDAWVNIFINLSYVDYYSCLRVPKLNLIIMNEYFNRKYIFQKYGIKLDRHDTISVIELEKILVSSFDTFKNFNEMWHHKYDSKKWLACRKNIVLKYCPDIVKYNLENWRSIVSDDQIKSTQIEYYIYFTVPYLSKEKIATISFFYPSPYNALLRARRGLDFEEYFQSSIIKYDLTRPSEMWTFIQKYEADFLKYCQHQNCSNIPNYIEFIKSYPSTFAKLDIVNQTQILSAIDLNNWELLTNLKSSLQKTEVFNIHYKLLPQDFCLANSHIFTDVTVLMDLFKIANNQQNLDIMSSICTQASLSNYTEFKNFLYTLDNLPVLWIINACPSLFETPKFIQKIIDYSLTIDNYEYLIILESEGYQIRQYINKKLDLMSYNSSKELLNILFILDENI